jgi:hypothetical protein
MSLSPPTDDVETEMHVLGAWQKLCPRGTDGEIDEYFGRGEISHWCALVAWIVNAIATNIEPNAMFLLLLWSVIAANASVGGAFVSWNE